MRIAKLSVITLTGVLVMLVTSGCVSQERLNDMKAQNRIQQQRIADMESGLSTSEVKIEQLNNQVNDLQNESELKDKEITALEEDIEAKKGLIDRMKNQLLSSGVALPVELGIMLEDFAAGNEMITFDEGTGMLSFKGDLLFSPGSTNVAPKAVESLKGLCDIMNTEDGSKFDVVIAGHTDDMPIKSSASRHPTNWHLSTNRAVAVLDIMEKNKIASERLSVRGFGEFRPIVPNKPNKGGEDANRRVEVYIVPAAR